MLYQTHHNPFLFTSSLSPHLVPPPSLQGMEFVPEPVKGGVLSETASFGDELCGGVNGDDFFVDELLDFSNGFSETEEFEEKKEVVSVSVSEEKKQIEAYENSAVLYGKDEFGPLPVTEMNPQDEGLESLEWLSHFVEESFSEYPLTGKLPPAAEPPCFTSPVQTKARTKRARIGARVWPVLSDSSTSSGSSTSSTTSFLAPVKERKKLAGAAAGGQQRRCSHCGVTKTPQWRAGPHGPKTLCNACGVRFKSGRLLPEYRPACSPTYSSDLHSNNHRKVMEMRRKRETGPSSTGFAPPVQSF